MRDIAAELDEAAAPEVVAGQGDDRLFDAFERLDPVATARELVHNVLTNDAAIGQSLLMSCRHALGFDRLTLHESRTGYQIRLHVWHPDRVRGTEDRHDHRASFASAVLAGELSYEVYVVDPDAPATFEELHETSTVADANWSFRRVRTVGLVKSGSIKRSAPERYRFPDDAIHRVHVNPDSFAMTLLLQAPKRKTVSRVYIPKGENMRPRRPQPRFDETQLRERLGGALRLLG